ncbi:cytochrome P450 [Herbaspirillum sp. GCM10030257]|uniref:cytochrome P450 n=1 Tax=Herbaspirillum sp. GCM10030257 TaxID=3273393 RepID=UPI00361ED0FF
MTLESHSQLQSHASRAIRSLKDLTGPKGLPFLGNMLEIEMGQMHRKLETWAEIYGDSYQFTIGPRQFMVCANPDDISTVLKDRPGGFSRTSRLQLIARELGIEGVFSANGDVWRRQRPLVMAAFNPTHVKAYFPSLRIVTNRFLKRWTTYANVLQPFDLEPELMRYTVDVTAGLAFGSDINTIESEDVTIQKHLEDIFRMLQKRLFAPFPYWHWIKFAEDRKLDEDIKFVHKAVLEFIHAARERLERDPTLREHPGNMLEAMIVARGEDNTALTESELIGNVVTMLLAGEDTTAHTLAWLIHMLYHHPAVMERVRTEVDQVLGSEPLPVCHEQLGQLDYIDTCINEAMRLRPVAPLIVLEACHDSVVAGTAITKGTVLMLLTRVGSMDTGNFVDASMFNPDRWTASSTAANQRKVSIPFGAGPRMCPGRYLALEEMKMVISTLVWNFDIVEVATPDGKEVQEKLAFTLSPVGLRMKLKPRIQQSLSGRR